MAALHSTIDCVENLQKADPDRFAAEKLDEIVSIKTKHGKPAHEHGGWVAPPDKPLTSTGAQMSIQYAAAAQLLDREVRMAQYGASKLNRPEIRNLMSRIHPEHDPALDQGDDALFKTIVVVKFKDGSELKETVDAPKGRRDEIEKKVLGLDKLGDVTELIDLLGDNVKCPIDV